MDDDEPAALDEMISLFVDINSYGMRVRRFDIVKAMSKDKLLNGVFHLIAIEQKRARDVFYRAKNNVFTGVLKGLQVVDSLKGANARVDRMWELLVEIILFLRTRKHRTPIDILKNFIKSAGGGNAGITRPEEHSIREVFTFLAEAYREEALGSTRLASNQIHFYSMITGIISGDLIRKCGQEGLTDKLGRFGHIIDNPRDCPKNLRKTIGSYIEISAKHSTHPGRREERERLFLQMIELL